MRTLTDELNEQAIARIGAKMSLRKLETSVIHCDGKGCDEVFGDLVPLGVNTTRALAYSRGWREIAIDTHLCPECIAKREAAQAVVGATPQDRAEFRQWVENGGDGLKDTLESI